MHRAASRFRHNASASTPVVTRHHQHRLSAVRSSNHRCESKIMGPHPDRPLCGGPGEMARARVRGSCSVRRCRTFRRAPRLWSDGALSVGLRQDQARWSAPLPVPTSEGSGYPPPYPRGSSMGPCSNRWRTGAGGWRTDDERPSLKIYDHGRKHVRLCAPPPWSSGRPVYEWRFPIKQGRRVPDTERSGDPHHGPRVVDTNGRVGAACVRGWTSWA